MNCKLKNISLNINLQFYNFIEKLLNSFFFTINQIINNWILNWTRFIKNIYNYFINKQIN